MTAVRVIDADTARRYLLGQTALMRPSPPDVPALLRRLRCIQLDPLDVIGTNPDLVVAARVDGLRRGDVFEHLYGAPNTPSYAFEHFAKERCLLPPEAFPCYRDQAIATPWWRVRERAARIPQAVLDAVVAEIRERGPSTAAELADHGAVEAIDWSGWKGTSRATSMALEVLWTRCQVVVCGRTSNGKRYDLPERQLPTARDPAPAEFARWALGERVEAAGLLSRNAGPHWSMLSEARTGPLPDQLVADGVLERVVVDGARREYLAPRGFLDRTWPDDDGRMRILGPLDPVLWDRRLVAHAFDFEYVWEVYKPAAKRRWGWYVCPLLHRGRLVGRFEPKVVAGEIVAERLWKEPGEAFDDAAFAEALARHQAFLAPSTTGEAT